VIALYGYTQQRDTYLNWDSALDQNRKQNRPTPRVRYSINQSIKLLKEPHEHKRRRTPAPPHGAGSRPRVAKRRRLGGAKSESRKR